MQQIEEAFRTRLAIIAGSENLLTDPADCWAYGYDNSRRHALPLAVVYACSVEQVRDVVRLCNEHRMPIVARGRGTGTAGASVPVRGGIVLSLERMNRILKVDPDNRVMVVEPGATNSQVQETASKYGFFWPPDPTSAAVCTIGGNLACNAAGPRAVKYGTTRDNVLGLRAVSGAGEVFETGVYTTKGVVGYDLTRLLIGSEGTLAIIIEANLKLTPLPEAKRTLQLIYRDIHSAASAVSDIMAQYVTPCVLEFMDENAIGLIRSGSSIQLPETAGALLMIEVDGLEEGMGAAVDRITHAARNDGLVQIRSAATEAEVQEIWRARKALSPALRTIAPKKINEDVVVPVSAIPDLILGLETLSRQYGILIVNFGHAGNGNIHVNLLADPQDPRQMDNIAPCLRDVFSLVLSLNGTLSGEHGIGVEKRDFVSLEISPVALDLMRKIRRQFDPEGILNPDTLFTPS